MFNSRLIILKKSLPTAISVIDRHYDLLFTIILLQSSLLSLSYQAFGPGIIKYLMHTTLWLRVSVFCRACSLENNSYSILTQLELNLNSILTHNQCASSTRRYQLRESTTKSYINVNFSKSWHHKTRSIFYIFIFL